MTFCANLEGASHNVHTDDHRKSAFLCQRLSILIQRYNAVAVLGTFTHTTPRTKCSRSSICSSF